MQISALTSDLQTEVVLLEPMNFKLNGKEAQAGYLRPWPLPEQDRKTWSCRYEELRDALFSRPSRALSAPRIRPRPVISSHRSAAFPDVTAECFKMRCDQYGGLGMLAD